MSWDSFIWFALAASLFWIAGALSSWKARRVVLPLLLTGIGTKIFFTFIFGIWVTLGYPPLRTMGETRLWFSFFLPLIGCFIYLRWRYRWILPFSCLMSVVFVCINVFKPEIHTEELMPALRSPWFVPHVIVYMFAYAVMGVATILALRVLWLSGKPASYSTLEALSWGPYGPSRHGETTGPGIRKRPGPPPLGSAIFCTCICAKDKLPLFLRPR